MKPSSLIHLFLVGDGQITYILNYPLLWSSIFHFTLKFVEVDFRVNEALLGGLEVCDQNIDNLKKKKIILASFYKYQIEANFCY